MKQTQKMWALWNYTTLFKVAMRRKDCREYANSLHMGGKPEADRMFRTGAFRITKVIVREV
jgi:hypothetical protein